MILITLVDLIFNVFYFILLARIIFSFLRIDPYHPTWGPIMRFVYEATEPVLAPVRRMMPPMGGMDFSPMIVLILAGILRQVLVQILASF